MSIFNLINDKIMNHQPSQAVSAGVLAGIDVGTQAVAPTQVDVEAVLEDISREKGNPKLNWRSSIVDLMKLLDLDPSLSNRAELAGELGYAGEKNGSAEMNIWLHRKVMEQLERNGGKVPDSMKR